MASWTPADLANQFRRAKALGWIPVFKEVAATIGVTPELLMAIGSRETNLRNILGDGGHGHGVLQVDDRSFPEWCTGSAWRDGKESIRKGAEVFAAKLAIARKKDVPKSDEIRVAVASYNAGNHPIQDYFHKISPDHRTTGHDYSKDVLMRAVEFKKLLTKAGNDD